MSKAPAATHHPAIELGRFAAALGVVLAHAMPGLHWAGQLALYFFVILTAFLSGQSFQRAPDRYSWIQRVPRLVWPWLFWCAVFLVVRWWVSDPPQPLLHLNDPWSLLSGPEYHLWFLPFLILATLLVRPVCTFAGSGGDGRLSLAFALVALLSLPLSLGLDSGWLPMPLAQWAATLPAYLWGLLLSVAVNRRREVSAALGLAGLTLAALIATGGREIWPATVLGAAVTMRWLWALRCRGANWSRLGDAAFGIYLVHPLSLLIGYKLFGADANLVFLGIFAFVLSCLGVGLMQPIPLLRRLI